MAAVKGLAMRASKANCWMALDGFDFFIACLFM
jgi:hypothetical protein